MGVRYNPEERGLIYCNQAFIEGDMITGQRSLGYTLQVEVDGQLTSISSETSLTGPCLHEISDTGKR